MLERILSYFQEDGFTQNSRLKLWQINKQLDKIISRDGCDRQFKRQISKQIFDMTEKEEFEQVILFQFLQNMEKQNKLKLLYPQSSIYGRQQQDISQSNYDVEPQSLTGTQQSQSQSVSQISTYEPSNTVQHNTQQVKTQQKTRSQIEPQYSRQQQPRVFEDRKQKRSVVQYSQQIEQESFRGSVEQEYLRKQYNETISQPLNATINESVAPSSSVVTQSFFASQTPNPSNLVKQDITPKQNHIQTKNQIKQTSTTYNKKSESTQVIKTQSKQKPIKISPQKVFKPNSYQKKQVVIDINRTQSLQQPLIQKQLTQEQRQSLIYDSLPYPKKKEKNASILKTTNQQTIISNSSNSSTKANKKSDQVTNKKYLTPIWYIPMCIFVFGIIVFCSSFIIHAVLKQKAIDQMILSPDNQGIWAHFPGDTKTDIYRNWTFFNITNAQDMLFYNKKPKFRQIQGFKIIQRQDYLNITYIEDGDRVQMVDWLHFDESNESRSLDEKVKVLNVGGLAYWYNLKIARPTIVLQQGLAILFTTLEESIIQNIFAQAINVQFISKFENGLQILCSPAFIPFEECFFMWNDTNYGFGNQNNLKYWIEAIPSQQNITNYEKPSEYIFLMDYFNLNRGQLDIILTKFSQFIQFISSSVLNNNYCSEVRQCTGRYLAYRQFADSYVTHNPPPGTPITPTYSICQSNTTCKGTYPQIQAYFDKVWRVRNPDSNISVKFDGQWMKNLVNYNISIEEDKNYNTAQNSLFHIGNLDALWDNGTLYDKNKQQLKHNHHLINSIPNKYLENIRSRFDLPSLQHAMVFWQWIKYVTYEVILSNQTNEQLGVGNLFANGLYQGFSYLQDNLQNYLLIELINYDIQSNASRFGDCSNFLTGSFGLKNDSISKQICDQNGQKVTKKLVKNLLQVCTQHYGKAYKYLKTKFGIKERELDQLCDDQSESSQSFGFLLHSRRVYLNDKYKCFVTPKKYCSDYQLAAIQWSTSQVTLNPPPELNIQSSKYYTYNVIDQKAQKFQYFYFRSKYPQESFPDIATAQAYQLLNFDNWFSASVSLKQFTNPNTSEFFKRYMRYVAIELGLNGLTMQKTPRQLIFGYYDPILQQVKHNYPPFGGDPSTPSLVAFNDPNITKGQATMTLQWSTGKYNSYLESQYRKINGLPYLTIQKDSFNGNITETLLVSPWIGQDYFYGTSAKMFAPNQFDQPNISLYVPNIQRYGSGVIDDTYTQERYGIELQVGYLGDYIYQSSSQSDINKKYYQTFRAIFNQTSVVGFPLFVCKNHFMNVSSNWSVLVDIYNQNETIKYENSSEYDDSFVVVEPYTGVSFQSTIYLQSNYYHTPDDLLHFYNESMLPVFSLWRSGNVTEQAANNLFGPLKTGLAVVEWTKIIGIILVVGACLACGFVYYRTRMNKKGKLQQNEQEPQSSTGRIEVTKSSQLGISLQPMSSNEKLNMMVRQPSDNNYIPPVIQEEV